MGERRWNLFWACMLATLGLVLTGMTIGTWWALAGMCIATAGFYGTKGPFWSMPSMLLTGTAAAAARLRTPPHLAPPASMPPCAVNLALPHV